MAKKRLLTEFGQGTSLRRQDYTEAAVRAVKDALWHNSINLAELFGRERTDMIIDVEIGAGQPDQVDIEKVKAVFPYGQLSVTAREGGLDVPRSDAKPPNVIVVVAISVSFDLEDAA